MRNAATMQGSVVAGKKRQVGGPELLRVALGYRQVQVLAGDRRGTVLVNSGSMVWITQEGDPDDHLLGPGDRFTITGKGRVVVQGLRG